MKLTEKQVRIFWWLRNVMLGVMAVGGVIATFRFDFLPAITPQVGGAVGALAGAVATWAGSVLPAGKTEEKPK